MNIVSWMISGILMILSGIHLYWLVGGKKGVLMAIPSTGTEKLFQPSKVATGSVAIALAMASLIVLAIGGILQLSILPKWFLNFGGWTLSVVFVLRAVGDFRWMGFFKRKKNTLFAKWDTRLYSPLCLLISVCVVWIINT